MANQPKTQELRAKKAVSVRKAYQAVFSGPVGTQVLHDLMKTHDILSVPRSLDHATLAYRAGEQAVIKRILAFLNTDTANLEERVREYVQTLES